ncbi:MAG TPA: HAD-IA family hydrolase [Campylobacterales bacterium]|nr:HAD-IA family hydrolase [Campylobacterales bacterium]
MKTTILFDLDGTLIDSTEAILESFYHAFESFDAKPPKQEEIESKIGYTLEDIFGYLGVEDRRINEYVASYKEKYREISRPKTYLLEGAAEALEIASSFARLGVVTTKTARYSKDLLEHMNVMYYFETLVGREDVQNVKPHPEPIYKALANMGKTETDDKSSIWMIGDTFLDIEAAKNAGIRHVALMTGYGNKEELRSLSEIMTKGVLEAVLEIKRSLG